MIVIDDNDIVFAVVVVVVGNVAVFAVVVIADAVVVIVILLERPHPQCTGTTKSQHRVGTRKRPPPKKTITSDREITYRVPRN